jgi:hypothetical protein
MSAAFLRAHKNYYLLKTWFKAKFIISFLFVFVDNYIQRGIIWHTLTLHERQSCCLSSFRVLENENENFFDNFFPFRDDKDSVGSRLSSV